MIKTYTETYMKITPKHQAKTTFPPLENKEAYIAHI